jgi:hypothetical protein
VDPTGLHPALFQLKKKFPPLVYCLENHGKSILSIFIFLSNVFLSDKYLVRHLRLGFNPIARGDLCGADGSKINEGTGDVG